MSGPAGDPGAAYELRTIANGSCDVVVSFMDIADALAAFRSLRRILRDDGVFVFSVLHPAPCDSMPSHDDVRA